LKAFGVSYIAALSVIVQFLSACPSYAAGEDLQEADKAVTVEEVVVTGSREAEPLKENPQTVGVIKKKEVEDVKPAQPSEIMNRVPGVWVNPTAGEGHMTAIRQPLTTNPVYLFLEDGIPIRPTGFFNHNALYEVNVPGADRIEITKGPASALYGSDAIGGTINVITKPSPATPEIEINPEGGSFGWYRLLATAGDTWGSNGLRAGLNVTHSDGWRDRTGYDRQSVTLRWDHIINDTSMLKTVVAYSNIDQDTGGISGLSKADFARRPSFNYQTFDFRRVKAFRISTEYEKEIGEKGSLNIIPFIRWNEMDLLPGWGIFKAGPSYFGYNATTRFYSLGMLAKYRHDFDFMRSRVIGGVDIDYSPGSYFERRINAKKVGAQYVSYTYAAATTNNFDFDATFMGISPYLQFETSPLERLRLTAGLRYDNLSYDYDTYLAPNANRPPSTTRSFSHFSPKAGITYDITDSISAFASYGNAFRAPSSGDLFRGSSGTAATAIDLKPIKVDSYEIGVRGAVGKYVSFSTSLYYMTKKDDIVSFSPALGVTLRQNAGRTLHKGIEVGLGIRPIDELEFNTSFSYAVHRYEKFRVSPKIDYSGNEISIAPRAIVDTRLDYSPAILNGGLIEFEWVKLGTYWMDDANTQKYSGYDLFNARASYCITKQWEVYVRAINIADRLYAEQAAKSATGAAQFAPGQPRTFYAGLVFKWGGEK